MTNTSECGFDVEGSAWIWEEDKKFEMALVDYDEGFSNRWEKVAAEVGTKSAAEVERHYVMLLDDVAAIEAGLIEEPAYADEIGVPTNNIGKWTEEEHRLFLRGVEKYGKRDWRSVSRYVRTRSRSQVSSHAQTYFHRQKREEKEDQTKKRKSTSDDSSIVDSSVTGSKVSE